MENPYKLFVEILFRDSFQFLQIQQDGSVEYEPNPENYTDLGDYLSKFKKENPSLFEVTLQPLIDKRSLETIEFSIKNIQELLLVVNEAFIEQKKLLERSKMTDEHRTKNFLRLEEQYIWTHKQYNDKIIDCMSKKLELETKQH